MHLIDITGAIACHRHTNSLALTAAVDGLEFVHTIRVGDMIILKSRVTGTFTTSLEVEVEVFSEAVTTGERRLTSRAYLTFVAIDAAGRPQPVPPLRLDRRRSSPLRRGAHSTRRAAGAQTRAAGRGNGLTPASRRRGGSAASSAARCCSRSRATRYGLRKRWPTMPPSWKPSSTLGARS